MLAKSADQRYQEASELAEDLEAAELIHLGLRRRTVSIPAAARQYLQNGTPGRRGRQRRTDQEQETIELGNSVHDHPGRNSVTDAQAAMKVAALRRRAETD